MQVQYMEKSTVMMIAYQSLWIVMAMGKWKPQSNPYLNLHRKFLTRLGGQLGDEQLTTSRSCWTPSRVQLPSDVPRQSIKDVISDLSWLSWFMKVPFQRPSWERKWEGNLILEENTIILIFASLETNEKKILLDMCSNPSMALRSI